MSPRRPAALRSVPVPAPGRRGGARRAAGPLLAGLLAGCGVGGPSETGLVTAHATALAQLQATGGTPAPTTAALATGLAACPVLDPAQGRALQAALARVGLPPAAPAGPVDPACGAALGVDVEGPESAWLAELPAEACSWLTSCWPAVDALLGPPPAGARGPLSPLSPASAPVVSGDLATRVDDLARAALLRAAARGGTTGLARTALQLHQASHAHREAAGPAQLAAGLRMEERALVRMGALLSRGALSAATAAELERALAPAPADAGDWHVLLGIDFVERNRQLAQADPALLGRLAGLPGAAAPLTGPAPLDLRWVESSWLPAWRTLLDAPDMRPRERLPHYAEAAALLEDPTEPSAAAAAPFARLRALDLKLLALDASTCSLRLALHLARKAPKARSLAVDSEEVRGVLGEDCAREPVLGGPWSIVDDAGLVVIGAGITDKQRADRLGLRDDLRGLIEWRLAETLRLR